MLLLLPTGFGSLELYEAPDLICIFAFFVHIGSCLAWESGSKLLKTKKIPLTCSELTMCKAPFDQTSGCSFVPTNSMCSSPVVHTGSCLARILGSKLLRKKSLCKQYSQIPHNVQDRFSPFSGCSFIQQFCGNLVQCMRCIYYHFEISNQNCINLVMTCNRIQNIYHQPVQDGTIYFSLIYSSSKRTTVNFRCGPLLLCQVWSMLVFVWPINLG